MTELGETSIALFTRDLRVRDNPVLCAAARAGRVVPLFVIDESIVDTGFVCPNRAGFLLESLSDLDRQLRGLGGRLIVRRGRLVEQVRRVAAEVTASRVHVAADVSAYAQRRTEALERALAADAAALEVHEASTMAVPTGVVTPSGRDHFAVFTPYFRRWREVSKRNPLHPPRSVRVPGIETVVLPRASDLSSGDAAPGRVVGGERVAQRQLDAWSAGTVQNYARDADRPALDGTSKLSAYLHFGCVSAIEALSRVVSERSDGATAFIRQLAWRDFHHQVLAARPTAAWRDYRGRGDHWCVDVEALRRWEEGRTGYPIVDAGMRQLAREGWMHNRARLIVASFLTKTLYLDWRLGARHFLAHLVDGDLANNQLNWQWAAGTGTDTRPNRVLNPLAQAMKYDPRGDYVRQYVPELRGISGSAVHRPWRLATGAHRQLGYPSPVVDLDWAARRFRQSRGK